MSGNPYAIRLWLPVRHSDGRARTLYIKTIATAHTPREGDEIYLWDETDDHGGERWPVKDLWWAADGQPNIGLANLVVDPDEGQRESIRRALPQLYAGMPWYSGTADGDRLAVDRLLTAANWTEWDGYGS